MASPRAEGILRHLASERGRGRDFVINSAGTASWHIGGPPDSRSVAVAARHGVDISQLKARTVTAADFERFDLILALDRNNLRALRKIAPAACHARIELFSAWALGTTEDVPDPYHGGAADFETVYRLLYRGCAFVAAAPNDGPVSNRGKTSSVT